MSADVGEGLGGAAGTGIKPGADGRKLRAGGGGVGVKGVGAAPLHDAQTRHGGDGGICPIVIRNIGIGIAGQKIAVMHLIFQKPEENGGGLRTGDQSIWVNIAIIVTDDIGKVVFAVQQLRCGAAVVPNRRAVQGVAVLCVHLLNGEEVIVIIAVIAAELGKALEPLHIMYFEEPTSPENPSNFRHIKQKCDLPLATGERSYTRWGFRQFFEDRTLSVIQPDLCNTGGITETKKICDMAQVYDMGVQIHVCGGPIATAAALQVEAAIPNFTIHEEHNANLKNIFIQAGKYYYKPENGYYTVPDLPGIGQEMTDEFLATCRKVVIGG